jgi:hypothetical protein
MHYYQHNIADYRKDTRFLTPLQHWAYRELLDEYYLSEKPVTKNETDLFWRMGANTDELQEAIRTVLKGFFSETDDGFIHKRCDVEIQAYKDWCEGRSKGGKASAAKAKLIKQQELNNSTTIVEVDHNKPIPINQQTNISIKFEEFWKIYPNNMRKINKGTCQEIWLRTELDTIADKIISHLKASIQSDDWKGGFIPAPLRYISEKRWEAEIKSKEVMRGR